MRTAVSYRRATPLMLAILFTCLGTASKVVSKPTNERLQLRPSYEEIDRVGDIDGTANPPAKAMQDTTWIADWTFDAAGGACTLDGWTSVDNRILVLADPDTHWQINDNFAGTGNMVGDAASVGDHNLCWLTPDGYANNWNNAIRVEYVGATFLSFDFLLDSEIGNDFLQVETDSACASFAGVDYTVRPDLAAADFRGPPIWQTSGLIITPGTATHVDSLALTDFGAGTHCFYISFVSDGAVSQQDGLQPSTLGVGGVIDNIELAGGTMLLEPFTGGINNSAAISFVSLQDTEPFGTWTRTFRHITDNDLCTENPTCALLGTDDTTPTTAMDPSMAFGPGGFVIRNWLDDIMVSPWVSLASTPGAVGTPITFRRFPGNNFGDAKIVHNWSVRGFSRVDNTDSAAQGDSIDCISPWGHADGWNSLGFFGWTTLLLAMERDFPSASTNIQVRLRTSDWQHIQGSSPPAVLNPGPGPYHDRVRIGRVILTGPVMDEGTSARFQAQDAFATDRVFWSGPPSQESFSPRNTRFGTVAFSTGIDLARLLISPNLITGDSITMNVASLRPGNFSITSVDVYGAIVEGPHVGQAPPGLAVDPSGFFVIPADSAGALNDPGFTFSVDFDDDYFMPGDVLHYVWLAGDSGGAFTSNPVGLTAPPTSLAQAQDATQGMFEVSFLPKINWDSDIVVAAQTGASGKIPQTQLDTPPANWTDEFAGALGQQTNCILYYQQLNSRRRTGDVNRTTFMYTLDALGYRGSYDVYDHQGLGNTNNQLGGRANVPQATGYALIVYDAGNTNDFLMPNGNDLDSEKIHQADWYSAYLAAGLRSEIGIANLWIISSNLMQVETSRGASALLAADIGVSLAAENQGLSTNPDVDGVAIMNYTAGAKDYSADLWSVQGGCPTIRDYDALTPTGTAVMTHAWAVPGVPANPATANAAIVQKANVAAGWNAVMMAFPLFDMRDDGTGNPRHQLVLDVLTSLVPLGCQEAIDPVDTGDGDTDLNLPKKFALNHVYPNPFNPITTITFDVPQVGGVELTVYDVMGRLVTTLWSGQMEAGFGKSIRWNGLDNQGNRTSSGVYFVHMKAAGFSATTKMVITK